MHHFPYMGFNSYLRIVLYIMQIKQIHINCKGLVHTQVQKMKIFLYEYTDKL